MRRDVIVLDAADAELASAVLWYEARRPGWGDRLLLEVRAALETLADGFDGSPDVTAGEPGVRRVRGPPYRGELALELE